MDVALDFPDRPVTRRGIDLADHVSRKAKVVSSHRTPKWKRRRSGGEYPF